MTAQRDPYASPAISAFANELRAHREQAGHINAELSRLLGYTPQFVSQIENCKSRPSQKFAEDCDTFFATNGLFVRLWKNIRETRGQATMPPGFIEYVEREALADEVRIYCALLLTGLFQHESYARAVLRTAKLETDDLFVKRMERKLILDRESPPQVFLVLDEGVIRRVVGGPDVMRDQLRFLYELSKHPKVQVQIIPYRAGYHEGLGGSLTILGSNDSPSVGYVESGGIGLLVEQPGRVEGLNLQFNLLRGHALDVDESRVVIKEAMEGYERQADDQVAEE